MEIPASEFGCDYRNLERKEQGIFSKVTGFSRLEHFFGYLVLLKIIEILLESHSPFPYTPGYPAFIFHSGWQGKMTKELEKEIRDLEKDLVNVQKEQASLRLQPCRGDLEMREKDAKIDGLAERAEILRNNIRDLTRKHQLLISEPSIKGRYKYPSSNSSS